MTAGRRACWRRAADSTARWIGGTAVYQVGRNSVSQPKKASGIEAAACIPRSTRPPTQSAVPRSGHAHETAAARSAIGPGVQAPRLRPRYRPTGRRSRGVRGTIFGCAVLPEVNRIKARRRRRPPIRRRRRVALPSRSRLNAPGPSSGSRRQIDDRYAEAMRDAAGSPNPCRRASKRRHPQIAEIALPFVCGEAGLSGTQTAPAATAIIATAASAPSGNTTATRSLRPMPRPRNARTRSLTRSQSAPYVSGASSGARMAWRSGDVRP